MPPQGVPNASTKYNISHADGNEMNMVDSSPKPLQVNNMCT
jgi:hypothetical protein